MEQFHNCISLRLEGNGIPMRLIGHMGKLPEPLPGGWIGFSHQGNELIWAAGRAAEPISDYPVHVVPLANCGDFGKVVVANLIVHGFVERGLRANLLEGHPSEIVASFPKGGGEFALRVLDPVADYFPIQIRVDGTLSGKAAYRMVGKVADLLADLPLDNGFGTVGVWDTDLSPAPDATIGPLALPQLLFTPGGLASHTDKQAGLMQFGPYSTHAFRTDFPLIQLVVLAPAQMRFSVDSFMGDFEKGMPEAHDGAYFPYKVGWSNAFKLSSVKIRIEKVLEVSRQGYSAAFQQAKGNWGRIDAVLVVLPDHDSTELYAGVKAEFLCLQVPSQMVRQRTVKLEGLDRAKALRNLGLNLYAKLGGQPWLLSLRQFLSHELVAGIGSTLQNGGAFGYATFFSRDGVFRLGDGSVKLSKDCWVADFVGLISQQIERLADQDGWNDGDSMVVTFHVSEDVPIEQLPALKQGLVDALGHRFRCKFSFLRLGYGGGWRLGDLGYAGIKRGAERIGEYAADRGLLVLENAGTALLQLRRADAENCVPLEIYLHPCSDESDLEGLSRQVFDFASVSWASMDYGDLPATLEYGNLITQQLLLFESMGLGGVVSPFLNEQQTKPWFL